MNSSIRSYPHVSHIFSLAPPTAAVAFDVMLLDPSVAAHLTPTGELFRAEAGCDHLRACRAQLHPTGRRGRTVDVVLELLPWSDHRCELTIRTDARPHLLIERATAAYLKAAHRALSTLAEQMNPQHLRTDPGYDPAAAGRAPAAHRHGATVLLEPRTLPRKTLPGKTLPGNRRRPQA